MGQYNVQTLYQKGRLAQLNRIMGEYKLAVMGVSEVRWNGSGKTETTNGNVFVYSKPSYYAINSFREIIA